MNHKNYLLPIAAALTCVSAISAPDVAAALTALNAVTKTASSQTQAVKQTAIVKADPSNESETQNMTIAQMVSTTSKSMPLGASK